MAILFLLFLGPYNKIFMDSHALVFPESGQVVLLTPGLWEHSFGRKESMVDDPAILTRLFAPLSVRGKFCGKVE